jgi:hypothetical protein
MAQQNCTFWFVRGELLDGGSLFLDLEFRVEFENRIFCTALQRTLGMDVPKWKRCLKS